jgi:NADPH2:quinone reductase
MYTTAAPAVVREATRSLEELVRGEGLRPLVGDAMPFLDTPRAVQRLADGGTVGRIVIRAS